MRLFPRPYRDESDLAAVRAVLVAGRRAMDAGQPGYYVHVGDVNWWLFYLNQDEDPFGCLTVWEDSAGAVAGWSLVSPHYRALERALASLDRRFARLEGRAACEGPSQREPQVPTATRRR